MNWDDEKIEELKTRWLEGQSATSIAAKIGGITRNGVLGKVFRMKLQRPAYFNPQKSNRIPVEKTIKKPELPPKPVEEVESNPFLDENGRKITLMTLDGRACKWPIGDPQMRDFHFCGHAKAGQGPYCPSHSAKAYNPPPKRMRRHG